MDTSWPVAQLGDVLSLRKHFITIDDRVEYKLCRVQWYGQGAILRKQVFGIDIKTKKQQVCYTDDFVVAEIDAKEGGFAVIPPELEGAIVSSHYFLFTVNTNKILPSFLAYYIRTPQFQYQVTAQGSTNYSSVRPHDVLRYEIPLPSINEQQRVVAQINGYSAAIREARALREAAMEEVKLVSQSIMFNHSKWQPVLTQMSELVTLRKPDVNVLPDHLYQFAGIYSFGRGIFKGQEKTGSQFSYTRLTRLRSGNFVYPKLMAWEGAFGIAEHEHEGLVVSPEFPVFSVNTDLVLPEVLDIYFRTPAIWPLIAAASTGTNVRRRRLHPNAFLNLEFPLPPMEVQLLLKEVKQRLGEVNRLQAEVALELDLLLPSILDQAFKGQLTMPMTFVETFGISERALVSLAFIKQMADALHEPTFVTSLTKFNFLLEKQFSEYKPTNWYEFQAYKHGPFTKQIYEDLELLVESGLITRQQIAGTSGSDGKDLSSPVPEAAEQIDRLLNRLPEAAKRGVAEIISKYGHLSLNDLKRYIYKTYPEYAENTVRPNLKR